MLSRIPKRFGAMSQFDFPKVFLGSNCQFVERRCHDLAVALSLARFSGDFAGLVGTGSPESPYIESVAQTEPPFHPPQHAKPPQAVQFVSLDSIALPL
jgi:hypothetical protein